MSSSGYWRPVIERESESMSPDLKMIFKSGWFDEYKQCMRSDGDITIIGKETVSFLRGVAAATSSVDVEQECADLIKAIGEFGKVEMWVEY